MENDTSALSKEVKRLNFGQFLFLYFVAHNTSYRFSILLLEELKYRGAPNWEKTKGQKIKDKEKRRPQNESGPPSYNSRSNSLLDISNQGAKQRKPQAPPPEEKSVLLAKYPELSITQENIELKKL